MADVRLVAVAIDQELLALLCRSRAQYDPAVTGGEHALGCSAGDLD